jgi:hypothetical protein
MSLSLRRISVLAVAIGLSAPLAAQQAATTAERHDVKQKPLNLSLPREAVRPSDSITRQDPKLRDNVNAPSQPTTGNDKPAADETWEQRHERMANAPYGTGFEARQRRFGGGFNDGYGGGYAGGAGGGLGGGGGGGGRGMGRGR